MLSAGTAMRGPPSRAAMLSMLRFLRTVTGAATLATVALLLCGSLPAFAQSSDLAVTKTGPASTAANTDIAYTITVTNFGPDDAGATNLNDVVPAGTTFVSFVPNAGCTTPAVGGTGAVDCTIASLANGASTSFTLTVHVPTGTAPGTFITNVATISNPTDPNDENNSAAAVTQVTGGTSADLFVTKSAPASVGIGQNFSYTIIVGNSGPDSATSASMTDTLPGNLTFVSLSSPGGWSCSTPSVGSGGTVSCSIATLAPNPGQTFVLTVNVPGGTGDGTEYDNTATVASSTPDPTPENDNSTAVTFATAPSPPDLTIAKTHTGTAQQGQTGFTYTITVSNVGTSSTSGLVTVSDTLPAGLTATGITGSGWSCTVGATSTCTRSDALANGASYPPITLTVNVASNAPALITNTATVSGGGDTTPGNNSSSDPTIVTAGPAPDLTISKTHSGNARLGQIGFVYTITVRNVGTAPSSGTVTVTDALPAGLTATGASGTGWACVVGATVTCTRSDALAASAAYPPITLTVNVATTAPPSVTNTATVAGGGDVNPANNTASDQTTVQNRPDPTKDPDVVGLINAQMASAQRFASTQISNFNERLEALHDDNTRDQMIRFGGPGDPCDGRTPGDPFDKCCLFPPCWPTASAQPFADPSTQALAYSRTERPKPAFKAPPKPTDPPPRDWAVWSTGYVSFGTAGANAQRSSVDFTTSGISAGMDYRFNRYFVAGFGFGYGRDSTTIGTNGTRSKAEAYNAALYASLRPVKSFFIDSLVGYGTLRFDSQRFIVEEGDFVTGRRTGSEIFASLTSGYEFRQGQLLLSPYARVNAAWITLDQFTETGGLGGALTYSGQTANLFTSVLGLRGKYTWLTTWGAIVPRVRVEYNHDFSGGSGIALNYADTPFLTFALTTAPTQRDRFTLGLGTDVLLGNTVRIAADYRNEVDFLGAQWHLLKLRLEARY